MNDHVLHALNNPTIGCSVVELKGEVITSACLYQGRGGGFEVACKTAIIPHQTNPEGGRHSRQRRQLVQG